MAARVEANERAVIGEGGGMPRYMIERTMPPGALDSVTDADIRLTTENNAAFGVRWIHTYMSRDRTKTFCIYEGPDEQAVRAANRRNNLPIDRMIEIPGDLFAPALDG